DRRSANVRAHSGLTATVCRRTPSGAVVHDPSTLWRRAHELPPGTRSAHRRSRDHRAQRSRPDHPSASADRTGRTDQRDGDATDARALSPRRGCLSGAERTATELPALPLADREGRQTDLPTAAAVPADGDGGRLSADDAKPAEAAGDQAGVSQP